MQFKGSMVALVTPFRHGRVDEPALTKLIHWHASQGTAALVPCGTTGESATLSTEEHERVIDLTVQAARGRLPVIAGTGSNNTAEAIELTTYARRAGADAALVIAPYYNRPTQEGLFRHFRAIAEAVDLPLIPYNIASRTGVNIEPETFARLVAACKNIVAVKEASGSLDQMSRIRQLCGNRLALISGDDALTLPVLSIGGTGVISVVANLVPRDVTDLVAAFERRDLTTARTLHDQLLPLIKACFIETNPIPVKTAMGLLRVIDPELRLPLCPMSDAHLESLRQALVTYGLLRASGRPATTPRRTKAAASP